MAITFSYNSFLTQNNLPNNMGGINFSFMGNKRKNNFALDPLNVVLYRGQSDENYGMLYFFLNEYALFLGFIVSFVSC